MTQTSALELGLSLLHKLPDDVFNLIAAAGSVGMKRNERVYLVGGMVRDLVLGCPNLDVDLVIEGDAVKAAKAMQRRFGGSVLAHERFKTATWTLDHSQFVGADDLREVRSLDFITARHETYAQPGTLPNITPGTIHDDLARRDFAINTLAILLDDANLGELLDPFDAMRDLHAGVIRVLHDQSFMDDPTRILRAARYEQRYNFHIEPHTESLVAPALAVIAHVSGERIWHELERIGAEAFPERALHRLDDLRILRAIHPALTLSDSLDVDFEKLRAAIGAPEPLAYMAAWLARLSSDVAQTLAQRLRLSRPERDFVMQLQRVLLLDAELGDAALTPSAIVHSLEIFTDEVLRVAQSLMGNERARERIAYYRTHWREFAPLLDGTRLQELGIVPGPIYRQILSAVRAAHLDEQISTQAEAERLALAIASHEEPILR